MVRYRRHISLVLAPLLLCFIVSVSANRLYAQGGAWIESELPASITPDTTKTSIDDDGRPQYLSAGKWLKVSIAADDVDKDVPSDGIVVTYNFSVTSAGSYEIWNRIGYEAVRSDFDWRIDGGAWSTVRSTDPTADLVELQTWNPLAWIDMGTQAMAAGSHSIQIRIQKQFDSKGQTARLLYASDVIGIEPPGFRPNDQYAPTDNSWQTDQDRAAAANVFAIPAHAGSGQQSFKLDGIWQIARDDETTVSDPAGAIVTTPTSDSLYWKSIAVPGDRDSEVPEWLYAHRYWLRTSISVPAQSAGNSYFLHFPSINMIATVFVNGVNCGDCDTPFASWDCDITKAVKPGEVNRVWVGIKDWYYALPDYGAKDGGHIQYIPTDWVTKFGPANFTFPVWNHQESGILQSPSFVVAGGVCTTDVFVKSSVSSGSLGLEITLKNTSDSDKTVVVNNDVFPLSGSPSVKSFSPATVKVPARQTISTTVSEPFPNAKHWWPDSPVQYNVVTSLSVNSQVIDERTTKFGYREWSWDGGQFKLNGVPWHGRADLVDYGQANEAAVADWHTHGQTMGRMWGEDSFSGLSPQDALDFYDSHGIVIRRTGIFDGEAARYQLTDGDHVRSELFGHWKDQLLAWAKGQRNHPSIFIWSIENEIAFINAKVTGVSAVVDPAERSVASALSQVDPTRPVMTDGGNALLDESMPVYGGHYLEPDFSTLPEGAYDFSGFSHRQIWPITESKPILLGEAFFAHGDQPADFAAVAGESAFLGRAEARPAVGLTAKMLSEGYRWNGINFQFWMGGDSDTYYNSWQPVAALCRQWDWTFGGGSHIERTLRIFNDGHDKSPITLKWKLSVGTDPLSSFSHTYIVDAGGSVTVPVVLDLPQVAIRKEGTWILRLQRSGHTVFTDAKPLSILPPTAFGTRPASDQLSVYDPSGAVQNFLNQSHIEYKSLQSLNTASLLSKELVIGKDALTADEAGSSLLSAYAASGHSVIVLDQTHPLIHQGLPSQLDLTSDRGNIGFIEDQQSPIFAGLDDRDFFTWPADGELYRNAYVQSATSGTSLVECGSRLNDSALFEIKPGSGLMLLCQIEIGTKLSVAPVAGQLLANLITYGLDYKKSFRNTTVVTDSTALKAALDAVHLQYANAADPLTALGAPGSVTIVDASPTNLATLATNRANVSQFTSSGGWIVLNNLPPAGISSFDKLVGVDHLIRPFRQEKVTFSSPRDPLTQGLSPADIVMGSGKNIFNWEAGEYPDSDEFSYVVDTDDIAPFCTSSFFGWGNITNGFSMADGFWPLIINFPIDPAAKSFDIPIKLPQEETIIGFTFVGDNNYWPQTKLNLNFGGSDNLSLTYDHGDTSAPAEPESYVISPPRKVSSLTVQITGWDRLPNVAPTIGVDNIYLMVKRPNDFNRRVHPILNVGALVDYPNGKGGIVLCNIKFKDPSSESNPENAEKKQTILAAILKNLDCQFSEEK